MAEIPLKVEPTPWVSRILSREGFSFNPDLEGWKFVAQEDPKFWRRFGKTLSRLIKEPVSDPKEILRMWGFKQTERSEDGTVVFLRPDVTVRG